MGVDDTLVPCIRCGDDTLPRRAAGACRVCSRLTERRRYHADPMKWRDAYRDSGGDRLGRERYLNQTKIRATAARDLDVAREFAWRVAQAMKSCPDHRGKGQQKYWCPVCSPAIVLRRLEKFVEYGRLRKSGGKPIDITYRGESE